MNLKAKDDTLLALVSRRMHGLGREVATSGATATKPPMLMELSG